MSFLAASPSPDQTFLIANEAKKVQATCSATYEENKDLTINGEQSGSVPISATVNCELVPGIICSSYTGPATNVEILVDEATGLCSVEKSVN